MFLEHFKKIGDILQHLECTFFGKKIAEDRAFQTVVELLQATKDRGGIVYTIGNGGSAGIASHFVNDLIKSVHIPAATLYDSNVLTCLSNDLGYASVFEKQLSLLLKKEDMLVAISSSGESESILKAVRVAYEKGCDVATFSGFSPKNPLRLMGKLNIWIPSKEYGFVEMAHMCLLHTIIDLWPRHSLTPNLQEIHDYAHIGCED